MKNVFLLITTLIACLAHGQSLIVTPEGLRDSSNTYTIISSEGKTATQLYNNALKYVNKVYKDPDKVIKGRIEGSYLRFDTYVNNFLTVSNMGIKVPIAASYTTELSFKDGRVKFEIKVLDMYVQTAHNFKLLFTGGIFTSYPIYDKKGKLIRPKTKAEIETYFNDSIKELDKFLNDNDNEDNW